MSETERDSREAGDWSFTPDAGVAQVAKAYAADLVDVGATPRYAMTLDYSDRSVRDVERIADDLYRTKPAGWDTDPHVKDRLTSFAKALGFYIGEVLRLHHGATWGWVTEPTGDRIYGMSAGGAWFWPTGKAQRRLEDGGDWSLWFYFLLQASTADGVSVEELQARLGA